MAARFQALDSREKIRTGRGPRIAPVLLLLLLLSRVEAYTGSAWPPPNSTLPIAGYDHELALVWSDHYGLLGKKLPPWGRRQLEENIEGAFRDAGVGVRWLDKMPSVEPTSGPMMVRVVLVPRSGEGWQLRREVLGAVMDKRLLSRSLYVFFPNVLRASGDRLGLYTMVRDPRKVRSLARALARVVAHEVVHAVDPELPHAANESIMSAQLTREMLEREKLGFDASTARQLLATLYRR